MMIESKYTIEYINPDESQKTPSKSPKNKLGFALGGLILAALAYFLITLPTKKNTHQAKIVISQQSIREEKDNTRELSLSTPPVAEKITDEATLIKPITSSINTENKVSLTPDIKSFVHTTEEKDNKTAQTATQIESLETLKAQLLDTKKRNKELATELDAQIMENMELATLLEDSLYKINKEDKSYIKELKKLEENTVTITTNKNIINKTLTIKTPITLEPESNEPSSETKKTIIKSKKISNFSVSQPPKEIPTKTTNRIDLSTASQVDAIIANIKSKPSRKINLNNPQRGRGGVEASRVKLQTDINDMINNSKSSPFDKLQESLNN